MKQELPDRLQIYRFKIDRTLGRGGTGTVYRGIDTQTGHVVALKLFNSAFFRSRFHLRDLRNSVDHFRKFAHVNVVRVFEFISGDEGNLLVQEYVDGPDLRWYIQNRPWDLQERIVIVAQICNGLQYIHDQGFTHHDLKPANILFTRKGIVKLSDYSLVRSKMFGFLDSGLSEQITPMYVSPEIIQKEKATPQSDIYSLGVTLYLMFTGRLPFETDNLQRLYQCHLRFMPEHPTTVNSKCPQPLGDIIMRMMNKDPKDRFESCDQLRVVLSEVGRRRI